MSPERPGSPTQEESATTPKMSVPASPVAGTPHRDAQSPISLLLAVAQGHNRTGDDDLTSLSWLHEKDVLKGRITNGMNINPSPSGSVTTTPIKTSTSTEQLPISDYVEDSSASAPESSNSSIHSPVPPQRSKHPHHIPYDPLVHTNNKPPYSFSCLIFLAIEDSPQKALPVKDIYAWILEHFPYFKNAPTGWKNSVRHNLSLNKCFQKVEKAPNLGKGSLWTVDEQYRPNLIQALTRTPMHPTYVLDPTTYLEKHFSVDKHPYRIPNPELYPLLSKKMARDMKNEVMSDESLDAVDAAAVMLSLKNGPRYRQKRERAVMCQVITTSPSQDHTYSAADSVDPLAMDEAFESDDDRVGNSMEDEEERKIKEGAETLLNLAGIATCRKRSNRTTDYDPYKRVKLSPQFDINENEETEERHAPFKPRLLRIKKHGRKTHNNNNEEEDEWQRHRRDLEQAR